jgi:hypothetical protein
MFEFLKIFPNKTSLLVGTCIGLLTYIVSTSLCVFASGCPDGNPFFSMAQIGGSLIVGIYCGCLIKGNLVRRVLTWLIVTTATICAALFSGMRAIFDMSLGGESFASHSLFYGVMTLIFVSCVNVINSQSAVKKEENIAPRAAPSGF